MMELDQLVDEGISPDNQACQDALLWEIILEEFGPCLIEEVEKFLPDVIIFHGGTVLSEELRTLYEAGKLLN
jgi:hypothetical protein